MSMNTKSIAITGISGRFPNCSNVNELQTALFEGRDLVTTNHDRWSHEALETSHRLGLMHDFEYFDAAFFGINPKDANVHDPRLRKTLEVTYEAIIDAGLNPTELRGTSVGVFMGISPNDISDLNYKGGILSRSAAIMANIVSYCFDFKGPSLAINTACSSSLFAFNHAVESIVCGRCDIAIVAGVQHQVDPAESIELLKFGVLHKEGVCRSFDANRKGYCKSEAIAAVVVQKLETCRRIYATIAGVGTNVEGFKRDGMSHPSNEMQKAMFETVHKQFNINPLDVVYVETHCTGTIVGDIEEVEAIDKFYTKGRKNALLIGSIKSNLGHTETTSGIVSIIKAVIAIREGVIPGNLHFQTPDPAMKGICEGRLKVIDKNLPLPSGLIAINSFGFGGANAMVILKPYTVEQRIPNLLKHRLVYVSGRTESGVQLMLEDIVKHKDNQQYLSLMDSIYSRTIDNNNFRGYAVLSKESHYRINQSSSKRKPVWFVYAGFGSQWPGMALGMMSNPVFLNTFKKCAAAVKPYGVDLEQIIESGSEETFNNIVHTFTAIMAVSVSLTDVLSAMDIKPDGIIGHSLGEIGCAYADGLLTAEEATLIAYARSYATKSSDLIPGAMAAVGLSAEECSKILPKDVYIGCENSSDNVTVSGPREAIKEFLSKLDEKGIFNRLINNARYPLHSPHLEPAGKKMYEFVKRVLPERKLRSKRWLSSAFSEDEWNTDLAMYSSAEYHRHNYLNKVRFSQLLKHVPKDAIVVEVAPRGLLQNILKRDLSPSVTLISLLKPGVNDTEFFLRSIGEYYNNGGQLDLRSFYKADVFPVSIDTPMVSSLVKWNHSVKWHSLKYNADSSFGSREELDMSDKENHFFEGHTVNGKIMMPAAGYIVLVWQTFAKMLETTHLKLPVILENVKTLRPVILQRNEINELIVNIFKSTGEFEITQEEDHKRVLASGRISVAAEVDKEFLEYGKPKESHYQLKISQDEFYNAMRLRGFVYSGMFMGVLQRDLDGSSATLKWHGNWVAFLDNMVQCILSVEATGHSLPTLFDRIVINPTAHFKSIDSGSNAVLLYDKDLHAAKCGGIEIRNVSVSNVKRRTNDIQPTLRKYVFVSNEDDTEVNNPFYYTLDVASQIVIENCTDYIDIKIGEIHSSSAIAFLKSAIEKVNVKKTQFFELGTDINETDFDLIISQNELPSTDIQKYLKQSRFLFTNSRIRPSSDIDVVYRHSSGWTLLQSSKSLPEDYKVITASNDKYSWVETLKKATKSSSKVYLLNEDSDSGLLGLFNTIRLEQYSSNLSVFFIRSDKIESLSSQSSFYHDQVKKNLTVNIYQDNSWGTYRRLPLESVEPRLMPHFCLIKNQDEVKWVQKSPYDQNSKVFVHYASLSRWDSLILRDQANLDVYQTRFLGMEYSGVDPQGNNVMGLLPKGALASSVVPHPQLTWKFSNKMSCEDAASVPLAFTLGYYSLFVRGHLSPEETVLIHNPTNEFGVAAISLLLNHKQNIYVVASLDEATMLKEKFSTLNDDRILRSNDGILYNEVMRRTKGRGVNVVFNCNSLELITKSRKYIAKYGRFVEIGLTFMNSLLANDLMENSCSFYNVNYGDIFEESEEVLLGIKSVIDRLLKEKSDFPVAYNIFDKNNIESALNHIEAGANASKAVIKIVNNKMSKLDNNTVAYTRTYFNPQKSYIIIGGLGGFGFELAKWLIERGATKIILNSRSDVSLGYHSMFLQKWNNEGLTVISNTCDTSTKQGAKDLIDLALTFAPLGGIFNAALHVQDDFMSDLTPEDFVAVAKSKIFSANNMDMVSRECRQNLDYFVMFSSIASSIGNTMQANYAYVNSAMERVCERRRKDGLSGSALEWGPLADVGILVKKKLTIQYLETQRQKLSSCFNVLDRFLQESEVVASSCVYADDDEMVSEKKTTAEVIASLFGIRDVSEVEDSTTLLELGMDSLLAFEIKYILSKEAGSEISVGDIQNMTFEDIRKMSSKQ